MRDSYPPRQLPSGPHLVPEPEFGYGAAGQHGGTGAYFAPPDPLFDEQSSAIDFRAVFGAIRRRVWLVVGVCASVIGASAFYFMRQPPEYRAVATIRLADERRQLTGGIDGDMGKLMGQGTDPVLSQIQVLESNGVAGEVVSREPLGIRAMPIDFPVTALRGVSIDRSTPDDTLEIMFGTSALTVSGLGAVHRGPYGVPVILPGAQFTIERRPAGIDRDRLVIRDFDAALAAVQRNLLARPRKGTDVIDVEYVANDPHVAQGVANAVVRTFTDLNAQGSQQLSVKRRQFIEEQLRQTDSTLLAAQQALTEYRTRQQVFGSTEQIAQGQASLMQIDMRRGELEADRQVASRLLAELGRNRGVNDVEALRTLVSSPSIAANPVVAQLYTELVQYGRVRDSLTAASAAATNPDLQRVSSLISQSEQRLVAAVRSHIQSLEARIEALDSIRARNAAGLQQLPQAEAEEERLKQRVASTLAIADQLRQEYQKARIAEAVESGQVQILDMATVPPAPMGTSLELKLAMAALLGLLLSVGLVLFLEQMNTAIRTREDIEKYLRTPALAVIPRIERSNDGVGMRKLIGKKATLSDGSAVVMGTNGKSNAGNGRAANLLTDIDAGANGGEAYRTLRTNLIFSRSTSGLRTIVVTSPAPGDGKTTTAANLAVAFAHQGLRVLLVDCDLRRARVHEVFGLRKEPGLTQALLGFKQLSDVVVQTQVDGLFVLPAGTTPPNPSELLGGSAMKKLISTLSEQYDLVVLDSPPLLAAADSAILGRQTDGVMLVTRAGTSDRAAAAMAVQQLRAVGARVLGAVLNDPDKKVPTYGSYYYYAYQNYSST